MVGRNSVCREQARRRGGPLLFGWGLLGMSTLASFVAEEGRAPLDLSEEDPPGRPGRALDVGRMLHVMAHYGLGGCA